MVESFLRNGPQDLSSFGSFGGMENTGVVNRNHRKRWDATGCVNVGIDWRWALLTAFRMIQ